MPGLAGLHVEYAKAAQFDSVALFERLLHGFEDSLDRHLGFGFGDAGPVYDLVNDVQLDQNILLVRASRLRTRGGGTDLLFVSFNHMI